MSSATIEGLLRLIDQPRRHRGLLEDELARRGWPWRALWSGWIDELVSLEEDGAWGS
jgi:hypothetical protein